MLKAATIALLAGFLILLGKVPVFANGYDVYQAPLAWSPDGRLLAAAVNDYSPRADTLDDGALRLYGRNGEVVHELARGKVGTPSFSPDGKLLAAVVDGNLVIYEVGTGRPWAGFAPEPGSPAASGRVLDCVWQDRVGVETILYTAGQRFYGCACYGLNPDGGADNEIWRSAPGGSVLAPRSSSDGKFLLALMQDGPLTPLAAYERLVVWPTGNEPRLAAKHQNRPDDYHESNVLFLDSTTVLFQRGGWGDWRLYTLNLETGQEYIELTDAQHPALDASGEWLAYTRRDYAAKAEVEYAGDVPSSVRLRNRKTRGDWLVSSTGVYAELPALSPDGARIAWLEEGPDSRAVVAVRTVAGVIEHGAGWRGEAAGQGYHGLTLAGFSPRRESAAFGTLRLTEDGEQPEVISPVPPAMELVTLNTTNGDIVLAVRHDWEPLGAGRFLELVDAGFYDGAPWFRVMHGFVAQCGIAADPAVNELWRDRTIEDGPVAVPNTRGTVAFGKTGAPNSRSTHIFINYVDNSKSLDKQGFAPFAEIVQGMDVADELFVLDDRTLSESGITQFSLAALGGMERFRDSFPRADYILAAWRGGPAEREPGEEAKASTMRQAGNPVRVVLETTRGDIVLAVHHDWAPIGAAHFLDLVRLGFYDGAPWFRVIDRADPNDPESRPVPFVAQCGIAADPALNVQWLEQNLQDDPVVMGNTRGRVAYGKTEDPDSRSTHIYINFGDNSRLDARGFSAFAEVVEGMEVADALHKCEYEDQDKLAVEGGLADFAATFPEADYILRAYVEND